MDNLSKGQKAERTKNSLTNVNCPNFSEIEMIEVCFSL